MFSLMLIIVLLGIASRATGLFNIFWSEEVGRYMMIWTGFLGAVLALRLGSHVGIEFLVRRLPRVPSLIASLLNQILMLYFLYFMVVQGIGLVKMAARTEQLSPMSDLPLSYIYAIIPATGVLMGAQLILQIVQNVRSFQSRWRATK
jgi:TRAP-type C4-dicarboxylate transport system permease small subunit